MIKFLKNITCKLLGHKYKKGDTFRYKSYLENGWLTQHECTRCGDYYYEFNDFGTNMFKK